MLLKPGETYKYIAMKEALGNNSFKLEAQKIHFLDKEDYCLSR